MSTPAVYNMTDLHMHLIPGVDDGARSMEMSLEMLRQASRQGITRIFATPHSDAFRQQPGEISGLFRSLSDAAARVCPDMKLHLGCEVFCTPWTMEPILTALKAGRYPTMNAGPYVLIEFSQYVYPEETLPCVEALILAGYRPILAHLERYKMLCDDMALVDQLRQAGALIQINAYSLADEKKDSIRGWARRLVLERKADFLGTDAHRTDHRPPIAERGLQWLYAHADQDYADALAHKNARRLLLSSTPEQD